MCAGGPTGRSSTLKKLTNLSLLASISALFVAVNGEHAQRGAAAGPAPVAVSVPVSSANYTDTASGEMQRLSGGLAQINPVLIDFAPLGWPLRSVLVPGELYKSDSSFEETHAQRAVAWAKKGFVNALDEQNRVVEPKVVDRILRVSAGERDWRNPTVRSDRLGWRDGMTPRPRGHSLTTWGGEVVGERRAGGDDSAPGAAVANQGSAAFGSSGPGGGPGSVASTPARTSSGGSTPLGEYQVTREFYMIVVEAFYHADLKWDGASAQRGWTTFGAAPRQPGQQFFAVLNTMLRVAAPYFGEMMTGLQIFNDARAEVLVGQATVIED